VTPGANKAE